MTLKIVALSALPTLAAGRSSANCNSPKVWNEPILPVGSGSQSGINLWPDAVSDKPTSVFQCPASGLGLL